MVSILLALAVSGICSDAPPHSREVRQQGANKSLKRDLEFYCKEMCRVLKGKDELAVVLGQALYVMGKVSMEYSNEYALVFGHLNELLLSTTQALRAHRSLHFVKDAVISPKVRQRARLLQRTSRFTRESRRALLYVVL